MRESTKNNRIEQSMKANVVISTLYQLLTVLTPLITTPYVSGILGAERVGIYSYTAAYEMYFAMFASLGTGAYGLREISRRRKNAADYSKTFWEIELMSAMTTAVVLVAWGAWIFFHPEDRIYYCILTISIVAVLFDISWFYMGLEQFRCTVTVNTVCKLFSVAAIFALVRDGNDLPVYIGIMSTTALCANLGMWLYLPRFLGAFTGKLHFGHHLKETMIYFIPNVATSIYTVLDKSLINIITKSDAQNGYYEQATKIINMLKAVTFTGLNNVFGSRFSYLFEEESYDEIKEKLKLSVGFVLTLGVGMCFGILAVAPYFVPAFFGEGYEGVTPILMILGPMIVVNGISNTLGSQYYTPSGRRRLSTRLLIIGASTNLLLNLVLIRRMQAVGASIASVVAELVILALYLKFNNGYMTVGMVLKDIRYKLVAGVAMLLVCSGLGVLAASLLTGTPVRSAVTAFASGAFMDLPVSGLLRSEQILIVVLMVLVGVVIYIGLLWLLKDLSIRKLKSVLLHRSTSHIQENAQSGEKEG